MQNQKKKIKSAKFVRVLYSIINDRSSYLKWGDKQGSFQITNVPKFTQKTLPKYFTHKNFASFIRQLNIYGFKKIKSTQQNEENVFYHQFFIKQKPRLLCKIKRQFIKKERSKSQKNTNTTSNEPSSQSDYNSLKKKMEQYQKQIQRLLTENQIQSTEIIRLSNIIAKNKIIQNIQNKKSFTICSENEDRQVKPNGYQGFVKYNTGWPFLNNPSFEQLSNLNNLSTMSSSQNSFKKYESSNRQSSKSSNNNDSNKSSSNKQSDKSSGSQNKD